MHDQVDVFQPPFLHSASLAPSVLTPVVIPSYGSAEPSLNPQRPTVAVACNCLRAANRLLSMTLVVVWGGTLVPPAGVSIILLKTKAFLNASSKASGSTAYSHCILLDEVSEL